MDEINFTSFIVIFSIAIGTYFLRVSGLLLSNTLIQYKKINLFLEYLPAMLLISLIFPAIIKEGIVGVVAAVLITICMYKTQNIFLSMFIGVLTVALYRNII